jgi:hypothetical protein
MEKTIVNINNKKIEVSQATAENKALLNALTYAHENYRARRIRVFYGDIKTGRSYNEEFDIAGYVSNSTGNTPILILVHNRNARGGGAILDSAIVRIDCTTTKTTLYKHANFHTGLVRQQNAIYNVATGTPDLHAIFGDENKAISFLDFMEGKKYRK